MTGAVVLATAWILWTLHPSSSAWHPVEPFTTQAECHDAARAPVRDGELGPPSGLPGYTRRVLISRLGADVAFAWQTAPNPAWQPAIRYECWPAGVQR